MFGSKPHPEMTPAEVHAALDMCRKAAGMPTVVGGSR